MNYSGGGAEPAAASCRSQFRESLASYPYSAAASHKGLLWAAASCRSLVGNHWCSLFAPPPQAERLALGLLPLGIEFFHIMSVHYHNVLICHACVKEEEHTLNTENLLFSDG